MEARERTAYTLNHCMLSWLCYMFSATCSMQVTQYLQTGHRWCCSCLCHHSNPMSRRCSTAAANATLRCFTAHRTLSCRWCCALSAPRPRAPMMTCRCACCKACQGHLHVWNEQGCIEQRRHASANTTDYCSKVQLAGAHLHQHTAEAW
jgi:hypothetical protein